VEIRELQQRLGLTTMMVTHDQEEALTMADRLVVMAEGQIRQIGSQRDLYERPANRFVAGFVGRANFMDGTMDTAGHFLSSGGTSIRLGARGNEAGAVTFSIRPEHVHLTAQPLQPATDEGFNRLHGTVTVASYLGAATDIHVLLPTGERMIASVPNRPDVRMPVVGESVELGWPMDSGLILTD
jgi:putative spermidine/putrescine transport system ATP-binding protein